MKEHIGKPCPKCKNPLELWANGDNGPQDDRWTCATCGIEYPHSRFPLPAGYVKEALAIEKAQAKKQHAAHEQELLVAWNAGEPIRA